ncbi:unnamed protein product [Cuscuta epithymum]|uniref:RRM domain-containing protein n=1 Tax=Cuscuta epithymum TaxID=186058 RepID=A0AAV0DTQ0_9ASTE|nr:unnamed protein product [Cuscuta epithymum]CAH9135516.1 unnamed protein product [Cuscuta epithymum]
MSEEDFKVFHGIDRMLFTRLVIGLGRDPAESMQLMAFLLWLERRAARNGVHLVDQVLSLPPQSVNEVADEAALCLKCIENEHFPVVFMAPNLTKMISSIVSPVDLRRNRVNVLRGVNKYVNEVCFRAFDDILRLHRLSTAAAPTAVFSGPMQVGSTSPTTKGGVMEDKEGGGGNKGGGVHPDERTIFLTFSKGYPISEQEVADFFSRKFGDSIESIQMQEVASGEQVLYAKLVARSLGALDTVVRGGRAKYNINGKHVWARKYIKKKSSSTNKNSPSPLLPSSPPLTAAAASSSNP